MKAKGLVASMLLVSVLMTGCSIGGTEVVSSDKLKETTDQLKQKAQERLTSLINDPELQNQLMKVANVSQEQVDQWLGQLVKDPIIAKANEQLGADVVQQVIEEMVANNRGVLDAAAIVLIQKELEKRMAQ